MIYLTKNGGRTFVRSLRAAMTQQSDFMYEVLVIDSGSTDGTAELAEREGARVVRILPSEFNYGTSKNLGAKLARGEFLVFLSQDNVPAAEDWLSKLLRRFENDVGAVQGPSLSESDGYYWWKAGGFFFTRETRRWLRDYGIGLSSCNLAIRSGVLSRTPFSAVPMMEDKVLQRDLRSTGVVVVTAEDAPVLHTHRYAARDLALRLENEGLGWRYAGARYSLVEMVLDITSPRMWARAMQALFTGRLRGLHEFLFPLLRPLMVYKGLHYTAKYRWERELTTTG